MNLITFGVDETFDRINPKECVCGREIKVKELPELEKLSKELQKQGDSSKLNFLAVCISDTQKAFSSFMKSNGYTFPGGLDAKGDIAMDYRIQGVPTSILISPEGKIQKIYVGMMSPDQLKNFISEYEKYTLSSSNSFIVS